MATAGTISIFVRAVTQDFDKKIAGVHGSIKSLTKGFADIAGAVYVAQQAFNTATRVVSAFADEVKRLDDIGDLAARFNITTDAVQRLQRTFELSGSQAESLSRVMGKLQVNIGDANNGNSGVSKALERINLSGEQLASMSLDQSFEKIVRQIAKLPNPTERASVAMDLLGKSSVEIMEIFTRENVFEDAAKDVEEFGIKMDKVATENIGKAAEEMERLGMAWKSLKAELTIGAAPAATGAANAISRSLTGTRQLPLGERLLFQALGGPLAPFVRGLESKGGFFPSLTLGGDGASLAAPRPPGLQTPGNIGKSASIQAESLMREFDSILSAGLAVGGIQGAARPGGLDFIGGPTNRAFLQRAIGIDALGAPGLRGATGGAAALEFGSTGAFSAIQQSKREDEMRKLQKQEVEETKKINTNLEKILDAGSLLFSLDLQP